MIKELVQFTALALEYIALKVRIQRSNEWLSIFSKLKKGNLRYIILGWDRI